jgi:hypothetical protein
MIEQLFEEQILKYCTEDQVDTTTMSPEEFAMMRRNGLGASDMSAVLGTMDKFRTRDDVLQNKLQLVWTEEEQAIGKKVNVRKGTDLEPLILQKAEEILNLTIIKPTVMYRHKDYPWLTVNFDGIAEIDNVIVPIEAKFTSTYADKYWDYTVKDHTWLAPTHGQSLDYINALAKTYGVPPYYLVQVQVQLFALRAPFGYLLSLRDKDWTVYPFKIDKDQKIQDEILIEGHKLWTQIQKIREMTR